MKKIGDLIKPYASVVFGALLLLYYLNWLTGQGTMLAIGIIALLVSIFYLAYGILGSILGEKFPKALGIIAIALFPFFMFICFIIGLTNGVDGIGPTGWIILILSMNGSLIFSGLYVVAAFVKVPVLKRLAFLFAAIFGLVLLMNIVFDGAGNPIILGNIDILLVVIYALYAFMMFSSLKEEQPAK